MWTHACERTCFAKSALLRRDSCFTRYRRPPTSTSSCGFADHAEHCAQIESRKTTVFNLFSDQDTAWRGGPGVTNLGAFFVCGVLCWCGFVVLWCVVGCVWCGVWCAGVGVVCEIAHFQRHSRHFRSTGVPKPLGGAFPASQQNNVKSMHLKIHAPPQAADLSDRGAPRDTSQTPGTARESPLRLCCSDMVRG